MRKLSLNELKDLSFGTNIIVHITADGRNEKYNGVIVRDKIYYEDGKVDYRSIIEDYVFNNNAEVFIRD